MSCTCRSTCDLFREVGPVLGLRIGLMLGAGLVVYGPGRTSWTRRSTSPSSSATSRAASASRAGSARRSWSRSARRLAARLVASRARGGPGRRAGLGVHARADVDLRARSGRPEPADDGAGVVPDSGPENRSDADLVDGAADPDAVDPCPQDGRKPVLNADDLDARPAHPDVSRPPARGRPCSPAGTTTPSSAGSARPRPTSPSSVTLTIDGTEVTVPRATPVTDAQGNIKYGPDGNARSRGPPRSTTRPPRCGTATSWPDASRSYATKTIWRRWPSAGCARSTSASSASATRGTRTPGRSRPRSSSRPASTRCRRT